jgi:hypothetical protein
MRGEGTESTRLMRVCDELAKYGIEAAPSERPSWLVILSPSAATCEADLLVRALEAPEVFVPDSELLRADCLDLIMEKVTSVVGHPC